MNPLNQIQKEKAEYQKQINLANALKKLGTNKDFVLVFKSHYANERVLDLVKELAHYDDNSIEHKELVKELNAISVLLKSLDDILLTGAMAEQSLNELNAIPESEIDDE